MTYGNLLYKKNQKLVLYLFKFSNCMVTYIINMIANQDALHLHKIWVYRVKPIDLGINKTADAM